MSGSGIDLNRCEWKLRITWHQSGWSDIWSLRFQRAYDKWMAFTYGIKPQNFNYSHMIEHVVLTGITQWFLQTFLGKIAPRSISLEFRMCHCSCWTRKPLGSMLGSLWSQTQKKGENCTPQPTSIQVRISVSCKNFRPAFTRTCSLEKTLVVKFLPDSLLKGNKLKHSLVFKNTPFILSLLKTYLKGILKSGGDLFLLMKLNHKNRDVTIGRDK